MQTRRVLLVGLAVSLLPMVTSGVSAADSENGVAEAPPVVDLSFMSDDARPTSERDVPAPQPVDKFAPLPGDEPEPEVTAEVYWKSHDLSAPLSADETYGRTAFGLGQIRPAEFDGDPNAALEGLRTIGSRVTREELAVVERRLAAQDAFAVEIPLLEERAWYGGGTIDLASGVIEIYSTDVAAVRATKVRLAKSLAAHGTTIVVSRVDSSLADLKSASRALTESGEFGPVELDIENNTVVIRVKNSASARSDAQLRRRGEVLLARESLGSTSIAVAGPLVVTDQDCNTVACSGRLRGGTGYDNPSKCSLAFPAQYGVGDAYMLTAQHCDGGSTMRQGHINPNPPGLWGSQSWFTSAVVQPDPNLIAPLDVAYIPWPHWAVGNTVYKCSAVKNYLINSLVNYSPLVGTWVTLSGSRSENCRYGKFRTFIDSMGVPLAGASLDRLISVGGDSGGLMHINNAAFAVVKGASGPPNRTFGTRIDLVLQRAGMSLKTQNPPGQFLSNAGFTAGSGGTFQWNRRPNPGSSGGRTVDIGYSKSNALNLTCATSIQCSWNQDLGVWTNAGQPVGIGVYIRCRHSSGCPVSVGAWSGLTQFAGVTMTIPNGQRRWVNMVVSYNARRFGLRFEVYNNSVNRKIEISDPFLTHAP